MQAMGTALSGMQASIARLNVSANNIANFTGQGTQLLDDFRKNPKKYLTIQLKIF